MADNNQNTIIAGAVLVGALVFLASGGLGNSTNDDGEQLYSATVEYSVNNAPIAAPEPSVQTIDNFQKQGTFSVSRYDTEEFGLVPFPSDDVDIQIEASVDGKVVHTESTSATIDEASSIERQTTINDLPEGHRGTLTISVFDQDGNVVSETTQSFSVPTP